MVCEMYNVYSPQKKSKNYFYINNLILECTTYFQHIYL